MSAAVLPFPQWDETYHRIMAAALSIRRAVKTHAGTLRVAAKLWSLQHTVKDLLKSLDETCNFDTSEPVVREAFHGVPKRMAEVHRTLNGLFELLDAGRLSNRTLINASVQSLRALNDRILDGIEHLALCFDPGVADDFAAAIGEYERGETVGLKSIP